MKFSVTEKVTEAFFAGNKEEALQLFGEINNAGTAILMATHNFQLIEKYPHRVLTCKEGELLDSARGQAVVL